MINSQLFFSNQKQHRILRHILFWLFWVGLLTLAYSFRWSFYHTTYPAFLGYTFKEILLGTPCDIVYSYFVIYVLFPNYLLKKKYVLFLAYLVLGLVFVSTIQHYVYNLLINPIRVSYGLPISKIGLLADLVLVMSSMSFVAAAISTGKLLKIWFTKQKEIDKLQNIAQEMRINLLDQYIQPVFIPELLKRIEKKAEEGIQVSVMLQRLQRLSSYLIFDCTAYSVPLAGEINAIRELVLLEELTQDNLQVSLEVQGAIEEQQIVPFILFPLVENNFRNPSDLLPVDIQIIVEGQSLRLKIINHKPVETSNLLSYETETLTTIERRLQVFYQGCYQLSVVIESSRFIVDFRIDLPDLTHELNSHPQKTSARYGTHMSPADHKSCLAC